jgi:hypothetical protein
VVVARNIPRHLILDNGVVNMEFAVSYRGGTWASISIDVARNVPGEHEIESLPAIPLTESFGVKGPEHLPCLPLCHHIAQKLHGMTLPPRPGKRNERFRDRIDLLLMEASVRAAVRRTSRSSCTKDRAMAHPAPAATRVTKNRRSQRRSEDPGVGFCAHPPGHARPSGPYCLSNTSVSSRLAALSCVPGL